MQSAGMMICDARIAVKARTSPCNEGQRAQLIMLVNGRFSRRIAAVLTRWCRAGFYRTGDEVPGYYLRQP